MKTVLRTIMLAMLIISAMATKSEAGWLIYHESELKGQILDIDTKQPIEGAVVVVVYKTATPGLGAGQGSSNIAVGETLTDKEGKFLIPSYSTIIQPFSWKIPSTMIIYKPGYARLDSLWEIRPSFFTGEETTDHEGILSWSKESEYKYKIHKAGIVEIQKFKTMEERRLYMPSPVSEIDYKRQKLLMQLLNEERGNLNLKKYKVE